jgi:hypothetical protein
MKNNQPPERRKETYSTPKIERYGNLRDLTRNVTGVGKQDGPGTGPTKTGL